MNERNGFLYRPLRAPESSRIYTQRMSVKTLFSERQRSFAEAEQVAQHRHNQLALWRLVWFTGSLILIWLLIRADQQLGAIATMVVGLIGFLWLLRKHQAVRQERDMHRHLAFVNRDEESRLERKYLRPETGEQFVDPTHYYAGDLDVFGKQSLFRLLNRTHTYTGQQQLANWLLKPANADVIVARQQAVTELKVELDWRQRMEAQAHLEENIGQSPNALIDWATAQSKPLPAGLNVVRFVFPVLTAGLFIAWLMGYVPGLAVLGALGIHSLVLSRVGEMSKEASEQTFAISAALRAYQVLFREAEHCTGQSTLLQSIRQALVTNGRPASAAIQQLARLTEGLNYRRNPYFYLFLGVATLWDLHYLTRLEQWRRQYGTNLARWFDALGELEALNSLAGFAYAHPTYVNPEIATDGLAVDFTSAAHPLLPTDRSVANSLSLSGHGQTILITGSNMSGKSTFLRTVGANLVLALAGAVVSAGQFTCTSVQVFTSMRTQDSLEESTSSFYAELKRLQTLIGLTNAQHSTAAAGTETNRPVLYFLDEILKGTNSADRHRGAEALIRQMHRTAASGFVSTHDLELGQLSDAADFVRNYHFQSDLRDGQLVFDYKLRSGICDSFNASQLMRAIGIEVVVPQ